MVQPAKNKGEKKVRGKVLNHTGGGYRGKAFDQGCLGESRDKRTDTRGKRNEHGNCSAEKGRVGGQKNVQGT